LSKDHKNVVCRPLPGFSVFFFSEAIVSNRLSCSLVLHHILHTDVKERNFSVSFFDFLFGGLLVRRKARVSIQRFDPPAVASRRWWA